MTSYEEKIAAGRIGCIVPGCRRTFPPEGHSEIICGKHWRLAPMALRKLHNRAYARLIEAISKGDSYALALGGVPTEHLAHYEKCRRSEARTWERAKSAAIEKALGI